MMWKDRYKIGVEEIDRQHRALFDKTEELLKTVWEERPEQNRSKCIDAISFLKNYAVEHFAAEEAYQAKIDYPGLDAHRRLHKDFVSILLRLERRLVESDFALSDIKELIGFLSAWLIYHVANADQKIVHDTVAPQCRPCLDKALAPIFKNALADVLNSIACLDPDEMQVLDGAGGIGDIFVSAALHDSRAARVVYAFPTDTALRLAKSMTGERPREVDEVIHAILIEIASIANTTAYAMSIEMACEMEVDEPKVCADPPPADSDGFRLRTSHGDIAVYLPPA